MIVIHINLIKIIVRIVNGSRGFNLKKFRKTLSFTFYFHPHRKLISMEEDKVKSELSKLMTNIVFFFFFFSRGNDPKGSNENSYSTLVFPITERTPEFIETSRGFIHLNSRRRMRMLVGRSMRKWRWW